MASALVESMLSKAWSRYPAALARGESAKPIRLEQGPGRGFRRPYQRRRHDPEEEDDRARHAEHEAQVQGHGLERRPRLVEIHDLDDAEVVIGPDHAGHDADHGKPE